MSQPTGLMSGEIFPENIQVLYTMYLYSLMQTEKHLQLFGNTDVKVSGLHIEWI
jgi:hypothetical protein